ncbi:hypothetical protein CL621_02985 [archaeon]|nr:hypothetical protein [archaeon]|tara:strand:+ start:660 stop:992 length:333 start_codon:yes stop_codon:yes gene_type:complete
MESNKITIGLIETIKIKDKEIKAKIDTGSDGSSIDINLAAELKLGPILDTKKYRSSHGNTTRPLVEAEIIFKNKNFKVNFNIIDRTNLKYQILIGKNILKKGFLIDPSRE